MIWHNVTLFTNTEQGVLERHALRIEGGRIAEIGRESDLLDHYPHVQRRDGGGRLLLPGLTNAHNHFYGLYARGLTPKATSYNFAEILRNLWWALDKSLDEEAVYYSALIPAINAIQHGVTSIIDHHASPFACAGSLDQIEAALSLVGMRALLCYELSDRDGLEVRKAGLRENERFIAKCVARKSADPDHLFDGMMGLHASFTLDDETLGDAVAIAEQYQRGCHIHVLEDRCDEYLTQAKYGQAVVTRLHRAGVLGPRSLAAHTIFLRPYDYELLRKTETRVVHQTQSNMNNAVGRADVFRLLQEGIQVGIGTDGMSADLRREAMTGYLMHKHHLQDSNVGWNDYAKMVWQNNPAIYSHLTGQPVGRLEVGAMADLALFDYYPPTVFSADNFWGHFLYGIIDAPVHTTMINGKIVMDNGTFPLDLAEIAHRARLVGQRVWQRYHSQNL